MSYCPSGFLDSEDSTGQIQPGEWHQIVSQCGSNDALKPLASARGARHPKDSMKTREILKEYVNSDSGSVSWQWDYVRSRVDILSQA